MVQGIGFDADEGDEDCCGAGSGGREGGCCSGSVMGGGAGGRTLYIRMHGFGGGRMDYREMLLNWAKTELLKEKVKAKLDKKYGKELEALADALVEVMGEEGAQKKEIAQKKESTRKKLKSFLEDGEVV
ncbi:MAG: hypothetical protein Q7T16_00890 [Candidatus Burarchaeum sp.]|nr:hypothetical protein [Candidatus Burarchaeum sp.]MDO8339193.1 hypothetical protein [Candidatus Burarchaeum sp.]